MKRIIISLLILSFATVAKGAEKIIVGGWLGFSNLEISDVNKMIPSIKEDFKSKGCTIYFENNLRDGTFIGVEGIYEISPNISVGMKIGNLTWHQGLVDGRQSMEPDYRIIQTFGVSLTPIMVGGTYSSRVSSKTFLSGKLYFGYGSGYASQKIESNDPTFTSLNYNIPSEGSGSVTDISAGVSFDVEENLVLGISIGYMTINIPEMKVTKDVPLAGVEKGDIWEDASGDAIKLDLNGWIYSLRLTKRF